jgi:hypothetical protein
LIAICYRSKQIPTLEELTGGKAKASPVMSATEMAHNFRLWRHVLGQAGDAQSGGTP